MNGENLSLQDVEMLRTRAAPMEVIFSPYAEAVMAPMQIIRAATRDGAELLAIEDPIGTLEPGTLADIIAVPGDPSKDLRALERAKFVMKDGVIFKAAQ